MGRFIAPLILSLGLAGGPASAQGPELPEPFGEPPAAGRGLEGLMLDLLEEMAPAIEEMEGMSRLLGGVVERFGGYEAPEMLPNGDIIIRRRPPAAPVPDDVPPEGEIEL